MANARNAAAPAAPSTSSSTIDEDILRSLHRLARDLAAADPPAPFLRAVFASVSRRAKLLVAVMDDLLAVAAGGGGLPRSASLCLREVLLVLQRFKAVVADCSARSRMRLLLQSDEVAARVRELQHDLATLLDILPVTKLGLVDDAADLLALASRQCRRPAPEAAAERDLKAVVLALIREVEREIVTERERLGSAGAHHYATTVSATRWKRGNPWWSAPRWRPPSAGTPCRATPPSAARASTRTP